VLAICRTLALARAAFAVAVEEKPAGRFMIRQRTCVVHAGPTSMPPREWFCTLAALYDIQPFSVAF